MHDNPAINTIAAIAEPGLEVRFLMLHLPDRVKHRQVTFRIARHMSATLVARSGSESFRPASRGSPRPNTHL